MTPKVSIIMGSTSDLKIMEAAAEFLDQMEVPYEINALSAHRVPEMVAEFAKNAHTRGVTVIIAGAGGAAHLSILQMPAGIPVATMALDGARNGAILAVQILAAGDEELMRKFVAFKSELAQKIGKANRELAQIKRPFKTN